MINAMHSRECCPLYLSVYETESVVEIGYFWNSVTLMLKWLNPYADKTAVVIN